LAASGSAEEPPDEDMEEFPTAEMTAAFREQSPSSVTPHFGSQTYPEHAPANSPMPAVPQSGPVGPGEIAEIPANHSLDQLWAPVRPLARERAEAHHSSDADAIRAAFVEMGLDQEEPEAPVEPVEPVDTDDSLEQSFAPWRDDTSWNPPTLPRYGPPLPTEAKTETDQQQRERPTFSEDEFLR
jgi:hypothetical protein